MRTGIAGANYDRSDLRYGSDLTDAERIVELSGRQAEKIDPAISNIPGIQA